MSSIQDTAVSSVAEMPLQKLDQPSGLLPPSESTPTTLLPSTPSISTPGSPVASDPHEDVGFSFASTAKEQAQRGNEAIMVKPMTAKEEAERLRGQAVPCCSRGDLAESGMDPAPFEDFDKMLAENAGLDKDMVPGVSYVVLRNGRVVKTGAFGVTDVETKQPWRYDTICRIYSMTKNVTVLGFMLLVNEGRVSLEDPVSKFFPAFAADRLRVVPNDYRLLSKFFPAFASHECVPARTPILVKHLLTHTSGMAYGASGGNPPSNANEEAYQSLIERVDRREFKDLAAWCDELAEMPLRIQPGQRWEYSYGTDLLGRIMEIVSGQRLDTFLQQRIFDPLGMHDTTFALPEAKRERLATLYRRVETEEEGWIRAEEPADSFAHSKWVEPEQPPVLSGGGTCGSISGGLVSTINDCARLCLMMHNGGQLDGVRLFSEEDMAFMTRNLLPELTGKEDAWCLGTAGLGFSLLGSIAIPHADANWYDVPGEFGWGGLGGTAWAVDRRDGLVVLSFTQVLSELWVDEELRKAVRRALHYKEPPEPEEKEEGNSPGQETKEAAASESVCAVASTAATDVGAVEQPNPRSPQAVLEASNDRKRAMEDAGAEGCSVTPKRPHEHDMDSQLSSKKLRVEANSCGPLPEASGPALQCAAA